MKCLKHKLIGTCRKNTSRGCWLRSHERKLLCFCKPQMHLFEHIIPDILTFYDKQIAEIQAGVSASVCMKSPYFWHNSRQCLWRQNQVFSPKHDHFPTLTKCFFSSTQSDHNCHDIKQKIAHCRHVFWQFGLQAMREWWWGGSLVTFSIQWSPGSGLRSGSWLRWRRI